MARPICVNYFDDEHGRYVKFKMSNNLNFEFKMDLLQFSALECDDRYYAHQMQVDERAIYIRKNERDGNHYTYHIHRQIMLDDPLDRHAFVKFIDGDTTNIRLYNMRIIRGQKSSKSDEENEIYLRYGARGFSIAFVPSRNRWQVYHYTKYVASNKDREIVMSKVGEYIAKNNLKDKNERPT